MSVQSKKSLCRAGQILLFVLLAFISLFPLLWAVSSSLRSDTEIFEYMMPFQYHTFIPKVWTVEAYIAVFRDYQFFRPIMNTLITSVTTIVFSCLVNSIAAFGFSTFRFKGKNALYMVVLISFMVPFEAIAIPLYSVVNQFKWVDTYQGLIVPTIADGLVLFLFVQFFRDMPASFYESARLDGAKWRTIFIRILMPLSMPVFVTAGLMVFINQWNAFLWPLLVAHGRDMRLIQVALSDFQTEHQTMWSCLYASAVISALIPVVLFLPFQKYYVQGITASGIKG